MSWRSAFPEYDDDFDATIARAEKITKCDWLDDSWGNDTCPSMLCVSGVWKDVKVFVEWKDPSRRESDGLERFTMYDYGDTGFTLDGYWTSSLLINLLNSRMLDQVIAERVREMMRTGGIS